MKFLNEIKKDVIVPVIAALVVTFILWISSSLRKLFLFTDFQGKSWMITLPITLILILLVIIYSLRKMNSSLFAKDKKREEEGSNPAGVYTRPVKLGRAELGLRDFKNIEWNIYINYEYELEGKPNPADFVERIYFSDNPHCKLCNSGLKNAKGKNVYRCANDPDHCEQKSDIIKIEKGNLLKILRGDIINDYDNYWNSYVQQLLRQ